MPQPLAPTKDAYRSGFADLSADLLKTLGSPAMVNPYAPVGQDPNPNQTQDPMQGFDMSGLAQTMGQSMARYQPAPTPPLESGAGGGGITSTTKTKTDTEVQDNSATMGAVAKGLDKSSQSQGVGAMVGGTAGTGVGAMVGGPQGAAIGQSVGTMAGSLVDYFASAGDRARKAKAAEDAKIQAEKMRRMQEASQAKASMQADENRAMAMDDRTHNLDLQRQREQATVAQSVMNVIQNRDTARGLGGYGVNETARMGAAPILTPRKY
jgi:hypothetical protein